jgi:TolB-like protein
MKSVAGNIKLFVLLFAFCVCSCLHAQKTQDKTAALAVLNFYNSKKQLHHNGENLSLLIFAGLSELDNLKLVERKKLAEIMKEQKLTASGLCSKQGALKLGGLAGADYIMTGRIYAFDSKTYFNAKIINCRNGKTFGIARAYADNKKTQDLLTGFADVVVKYVNKKLCQKK